MQLMTATSHLAAPPPAGFPLEGTEMQRTEIATPFGPVSVDDAGILRIPGGILGFDSLHDFALAPIPNARLARFMILQSMEDPSVSFIVLPMAEDGPIEAADRDEACAMLGARVEDAAFLLIVTVRSEGGKRSMTVNLRAPIVVDTGRRTARQCVLSNNGYSVRHPL